jgi:hypothetical protein
MVALASNCTDIVECTLKLTCIILVGIQAHVFAIKLRTLLQCSIFFPTHIRLIQLPHNPCRRPTTIILVFARTVSDSKLTALTIIILFISVVTLLGLGWLFKTRIFLLLLHLLFPLCLYLVLVNDHIVGKSLKNTSLVIMFLMLTIQCRPQRFIKGVLLIRWSPIWDHLILILLYFPVESVKPFLVIFLWELICKL